MSCKKYYFNLIHIITYKIETLYNIILHANILMYPTPASPPHSCKLVVTVFAIISIYVIIMLYAFEHCNIYNEKPLGPVVFLVAPPVAIISLFIFMFTCCPRGPFV